MTMIAVLTLAAALAHAADRRAETPRIELASMPVAAPAEARALPGGGLSLPSAASLPSTPALSPAAAAPDAPIPALPAAAMAESRAPVPAPEAARNLPLAEISAGPAAATPSAPHAGQKAAPSATPPQAGADAKPGFAAKVGRILARIVNPFGGEKKPQAVPPAVAARRTSYVTALAADHWLASKPTIAADLAALRALETKQEKQEFLRRVGAQVVAELQARHGAKELGFHFNLHGGRPEGYVVGNGIHATMGDIALQYTMSGDRNYKVYFFRSSRVNLYDALNESNPAQLVFPSRMGDVFMVFRLDAASLERGRRAGAIPRESPISMDFETDKLGGVPYEAFAVPPSQVFRVPKALGLGKLSRDEETLAAMRYIERLGLSADTPLAR